MGEETKANGQKRSENKSLRKIGPIHPHNGAQCHP